MMRICLMPSQGDPICWSHGWSLTLPLSNPAPLSPSLPQSTTLNSLLPSISHSLSLSWHALILISTHSFRLQPNTNAIYVFFNINSFLSLSFTLTNPLPLSPPLSFISLNCCCCCQVFFPLATPPPPGQLGRCKYRHIKVSRGAHIPASLNNEKPVGSFHRPTTSPVSEISRGTGSSAAHFGTNPRWTVLVTKQT